MKADFHRFMAEFSYELKVPKERIAILIGKEGSTKDLLEEETNTQIRIDSADGDVFVSGDDALSLYSAREVVKAIARGFNPEIALLILRGDYLFELINLVDFIKSKSSMMRLKGRVIGQAGKSRRLIEELTDCHVSVYGKTIGIIGQADKIAIAKQAVDSLLDGSPHSTVYKWLEKKRKTIAFDTSSPNDFVKDDYKDNI